MEDCEEECPYIKFEFVKDLLQCEEDPYVYKLPERSTKKSAGYDFFNPRKLVIEPHTMKLVKTGVKATFPDKMVLKLYNRSSNPKKKGLVLMNGVGIIDADYYGNEDNDGEIGFMFYNFKDEPAVLETGDKLGQGIFERFYTVKDEEEITAERTSGWGSTGK